MKSIIATSLGLAGIATALPYAQEAPAEVIRTLPLGWNFTIASLKGPGCPDFGVDDSYVRTTRLTYGRNTMDGSEIYYWYVAYPHLRVNLGEEEHSWCETTIKYKELAKWDNTEVEASDYLFRLHKAGTAAIATYGLDDGVKATLKFSYKVGDDGFTDSISYNGPLESGRYEQESLSATPKDFYPLPKCGSGTFTFRTDLTISGDEGKKGFVASEHYTNATLGEQYYGLQQGFSYDWQKCKN